MYKECWGIFQEQGHVSIWRHSTGIIISLTLPVEEDSWNVNTHLISHPSLPSLNSQSFQHLPSQNLQFPFASDRLPHSSCQHEFLHYLQYCSWVCECNPQGWLAMSYLQRSLCQLPVLKCVDWLYCAIHNCTQAAAFVLDFSHFKLSCMNEGTVPIGKSNPMPEEERISLVLSIL